jgi:single-strand DNA-binding protein
MAGYNRIIMVGNLTKDPDLKPVGAQSVCKLNIASNKQYKNRQTGAAISEVCFVDVEVWGAQAESCKNYLQKGRPVLIEGRLKLDSWKDQEGAMRSKHSIVADKVVFLSGSNHDNLDDLEENSNAPLIKQNTTSAVRPSYKEKETPNKKINQFVDNAPFIEDDLPF